MHNRIVLCTLLAFAGCSNAPTIVIPTTQLTEEQRLAIAREDAEVCNCGKVSHDVNEAEQDQ